mgnify:CR=1 FL=1
MHQQEVLEVLVLRHPVHDPRRHRERADARGADQGVELPAAGEVEQLADLPSREVLLAKMLGTLNAPATNFVGVLAAVPRSLVTVLSAIEKKKSEA